MSSEGSMSVVGSEVMPLEYGGMDSESSSSPSSSERTVEERREREVEEEGEEEIPSSILEVGGNVGRCYDPESDIVSEVRGYVSELGSRSSLRGLLENCNLPPHVLIRPTGWMREHAQHPETTGCPCFIVYCRAQGVGVPTVNMFKHFFIIKAGGRGEKGWHYFSPRLSSKENRNLFTAGPSSIKGWKEKFFFVDDTKWSRGDAEVRFQLVCFDINVCFATEMDGFLNAAEGLAILKKPRKKSKTSTTVEKGVAERERPSSTSARALEMQPRPEPMRRSSEEESDEVAPLQRKKRKVAELEVRRDEVVEFVPRPSPPEVDPKESLLDATNITGAKRFLNATLPEVDRRQARDKAVSQLGARVVRHSLESASWVNALAQEYAKSVRDRASLQRHNRTLDNDTLSTRLVFEECKRKICEDKLEAQDKYIENVKKGAAELKKNVNLLVHNGMEEHIGNFLNSSTFENIINLYRLSIAILAFTDCRKKVKVQYPEVDVTTVTFGEQEEGVEEDGGSLSADFRPLIKLRWERDAEGCTIFPPAFDAELVAIEEEEEVPDAEVENQTNLAEVQPPEVHPVSFGEK
ncbi:hypothetical protein SLEP1_g55454 [Rubroshorea leprosula]|uniref:Uncharacterized protein n=1 Tax=Rubroshorea leprosula TaxID=152421 RepID=A0AAV5MFD9_9ROSI|nr:hypothetical protein SLEP1_g55454 [Rubroshorea leprosula]